MLKLGEGGTSTVIESCLKESLLVLLGLVLNRLNIVTVCRSKKLFSIFLLYFCCYFVASIQFGFMLNCRAEST